MWTGGEEVWGGPVTVDLLSSARLDGLDLKVVTEGRKEAMRRRGEEKWAESHRWRL